MEDVRRSVPNAKILNGERARFEIAGGDRRVARLAILKLPTMEIRPIRNDDDHAAAISEIERLWGAPAGTDAGDKLDILATLVEKYEQDRWPTSMSPIRSTF